MSTYTVEPGDSLSRIARDHDMPLNALLALNPEYKADPNQLDVGDVLRLTARAREPRRPVVPRGRRPSTAGRSQPSSAHFVVPRGQLTFDSEGLENPGGPYHSRVLHVPGPTSGATIGRGYDMKERSRSGILQDLLAAGIPDDMAADLAGLNGLAGPAAEARIARSELGDLEITPLQQKKLFLITYDELAGDVKRLCLKADVVHKYGATDWPHLDPTIKDVLVDLRYRGDYKPATRQKVQGPVARGDLEKFTEVLCNRAYWVDRFGVPRDRFRRRKEYLAG